MKQQPVLPTRRARRWLSRIAVLTMAASLTLAAAACGEDYNLERVVPERGTFGEEVHRTLHKDALRSSRNWDERGRLLTRDEAPIVFALDSVVPADLLRPLADLLLALRPLIDRGIVPQMTQKIAALLDALLDADDVRLAWEADNLGRFEGYRAPQVRSALVENAVTFPGLVDLNRLFARLVLDNDGFDDDGTPNNEPTFATDLVRALSVQLQTVEVAGEPDRIGAQAADLLLRQHADFDVADREPFWVVRVDHRGLPLVRSSARGTLYSPFRDNDGDGLADTNPAGQFIDARGEVLEAKPFGEPNSSGLLVRDAIGRAVAPDGDGFAFDYVDLNKTSAAFLLDQNAELARRDVLFDLVDALLAVLPTRGALEDAEGAYNGYPSADNVLLDLVYAALSILNFPGVDELLETNAVLLRDHQPILAELLLSFDEFGDILDTYPDAELTDGNTLGDDLVVAAWEVVESPGLVAELLTALEQPITLNTEVASLDPLRFKSAPGAAAPAPGGPYDTCFQTCNDGHAIGSQGRFDCIRACPREEVFGTLVDREAAPGPSNRSHFERTMALFRDTAGAQYEMKVERLTIPDLGTDIDVGNALPPLLRIEDAAGAFLESVAGDFRFVDHVTPEAIASEEVHLLLGGLDTICGSGFLGRLIQALTPVLLRVSEDDLRTSCRRFEEVSAQEGLDEDELTRQRIAVMVAFLSLLTDVPMDEVPTPAQLTRFFNTPNPSLDLEIAQMSLSQLSCHDGYFLHEHHGDMLFAAEASGLLDAIHPLVRVASAHGKTGQLAALMGVLHLHYVTPEVSYRTKNGAESARAGDGTGVVRYEPALVDFMERARLLAAGHELALVSGRLESSRERRLPAILEELIVHILRPDPAVRHRNGSGQSVDAAGRRVEPISQFYVLADALAAIDDRLDRDAQADAAWTRATDELADVLLGVEDGGGGGQARFSHPGGVALGAMLAEHLAGRMALRRDAGNLDVYLSQELLLDAREFFEGRSLPAALDLFEAATADPADRALLTEFLVDATGGDLGASSALVRLYEFLLDLLDEASFVTTTRFYGELFDPDRAWPEEAGALPLASHGMLLLRETDAVDGDALAVSLLANAGVRTTAGGLPPPPDGDPLGEYPASTLARAIRDYQRADPLSREPLTAEDYELIARGVHGWLRDDRVGMEQLYDLIEARKRD